LIANDSIFSPLTELGVQIAAIIAARSFRSSAARDEKREAVSIHGGIEIRSEWLSRIKRIVQVL
jgi:hypothetical protein